MAEIGHGSFEEVYGIHETQRGFLAALLPSPEKGRLILRRVWKPCRSHFATSPESETHFQVVGNAFVFQVSGPEAVHLQQEFTRREDTNFTNLNDYDLELQYWEHLELDMQTVHSYLLLSPPISSKSPYQMSNAFLYRGYPTVNGEEDHNRAAYRFFTGFGH